MKNPEQKPEAGSQTPPSKPVTSWEFTEEFDLGVAPPEAPARAPRVTELPFAAKFFAPAMMEALANKKPHKFIPKAFFVGRAAKPEKVNGSYMKTKVRESFAKWLKTQPQAVQDSLRVLQHERTGKEEGFPEAGISVWIVTAEKKTTNPTP
ncbi:hypothetical protein ACQZ6C_10625 [Rhizobium rhizogenes]